jgi:hypothetical protein
LFYREYYFHWPFFLHPSPLKNYITVIENSLKQGWAFLKCMTAINYLDMKMLNNKTEISYTSSVYSLDFISITKKFLGPAGDLQMGLNRTSRGLGEF